MKHPLACALALALATGPACLDGARRRAAADPSTRRAEPRLHTRSSPTARCRCSTPPSTRSRTRTSRPAFDAGMKEQLRRNRGASPTTRTRRPSTTPSSRSRRPAARCRASPTVFFNLLGADTNDAREKIDDEYAPKLRRAPRRDRARTPSCSRASRRCTTAAPRSASTREQHAPGRALPHRLRARRRQPERRRQGQAQGRSTRELADAAARSSTRTAEAEAQRRPRSWSTRAPNSPACPTTQIDAAAEAAKAAQARRQVRPRAAQHHRPAAAAQLENRALREKLHRGVARPRQPRQRVRQRPRSSRRSRSCAPKRAKLLGYPNHAAYVLEDETAKTAAGRQQACSAELAPAGGRQRAPRSGRPAGDHRRGTDGQGPADFKLEPWDWAYYAEKVRKEKFAFDENAAQARTSNSTTCWRTACSTPPTSSTA